MFCKNCGEEMQDGWVNCPKCGHKAGSSAEEKYVFFPKIKDEKREKINSIFRIIHMVVIGFTAIMVIAHIYGEIQAAEDYKMLLYVMRFFCMCGPYLIFEFIVDEIKWIFLLERNPAVGTYSRKNIIIAETLYIFLGIIAGIMLVLPSEAQQLEMIAAVVDDSFVDYIIIMKIPVIMLIVAAVIKAVLEKKVGEDGEN